MHSLPCPHCGAYLDIFDSMLGQLVECEGCRQVFRPELTDVRPRSTYLPPSEPQGYLRDKSEFDAQATGEDESDTAMPSRGMGFAITSLVLGICAITLGVALWFICCPMAQTLMGVLAIIFGYMGMRTDGRYLAISGMVCGALACLLTFVPLILFGALITAAKPPAPPGPAAAPPPTLQGPAAPPPPMTSGKVNSKVRP